MEAINILLIDRKVYESYYKSGLIYVFEQETKSTFVYINNKDLMLGSCETLRDKRFYGVL